MAKQWVLIWHSEDDGETFCEGVFDTYHEAVGKMMDRIWEFSESYEKDGDEFEIGKPRVSEVDGESERVRIRFKSVHWEKEEYESWYILPTDDADRKDGKERE